MTDRDDRIVLESIDQKMDSVKKLLTLNLIKGLDENTAIQTLNRLDMKYLETGEYLGLSENAVKMRVRNMRSNSKRGKKNGK